MGKINLHIVPHAHWDKEWYFTKQESDVLLKHNIDKLLNLFEKNPKFKNFTYDGQFSIIDDYLQYQKNVEKLKKVIKEEKLFVGPWYTQPDLFNSSSEAIVRNLLLGIKKSQEFGNSMMIAYVPDSFGQSEQMPQVYKQFDLNTLIYWRGVKREQLKNNVFHTWEGIDGTKINAINFLKGYWVMGSYFPYAELTKENTQELAFEFLKKFKEPLEEIKSFNIESKNDILIPLGGDQAPIVENLPLFFESLNQLDNEHNWIWSDYESYEKVIKNNKFKNNITGELKFPETSRIHKTIGSQRYDIKEFLKRTDNLLFDQLEPFLFYCETLGIKYDSCILENSLKKLLISNAHDSLGGCNSDITNKDVVHRIEQANQELNSLKIKILRTIASEIEKNSLILFNPYAKKTRKNSYVTLFTKFKNFVLKDKAQNTDFIILKQEYIDNDVDLNSGTFGESEEAKNGYYKTKVLLPNLEFEGIELKILKVIEKETTLNDGEGSDFQNKIWEVSFENNKLNIINRTSNKKFDNIFNFSAQEDAGDSYDFSPKTLKNRIISNLKNNEFNIKEFKKVITIEIKSIYEVEGKNNQEIITKLFLFDNNQIDLRVKLKNSNENIKWTINVPLDFSNEFSFASQIFSEVKRKTHLKENENWLEKGWVEKPQPIETNENFVYVQDGNFKIGFITLGNNEYEINGGKYDNLSLTLFRSVDSLGKNNLLWRPGRASGTGDFVIKTPDAELKKELKFKFTFFVEKNKVNIWNKAQEKNSDIVWYQNQTIHKYFHKFERFFFIDSVEIEKKLLKSPLFLDNENVIVKAIKKSYDNKNFIIRLFNPTILEQEFILSTKHKVIGETNMLESTVKDFSNKIGPNKIKNIILKIEEL